MENQLLKEVLETKAFCQAIMHILVDIEARESDINPAVVQNAFYKLKEGLFQNIKLKHPDIFTE
jgi:hypothetical protein